MKVKELVELLKKHDQDYDVIASCCDTDACFYVVGTERIGKYHKDTKICDIKLHKVI